MGKYIEYKLRITENAYNKTKEMKDIMCEKDDGELFRKVYGTLYHLLKNAKDGKVSYTNKEGEKKTLDLIIAKEEDN